MFVGLMLVNELDGCRCLGSVTEQNRKVVTTNSSFLQVGSRFQRAKLKCVFILSHSLIGVVSHSVIMSLLPLGNTIHVIPPSSLGGWLHNQEERKD